MDEILKRVWEDLIGRWRGPMSFRLVIQPIVASVRFVRGSGTLGKGDQPFYGPP
jgi:hypothetical protein